MVAVVPFSSLLGGQTVLKLPHPFLTEYRLAEASSTQSPDKFFRLEQKSFNHGKQPSFSLVSSRFLFTAPEHPKSSEAPAPSNNSAWARARRSACVTCHWEGTETPTLAQAWMLLYFMFSVRPELESLRLEINGTGANVLGEQLISVLLAIAHPRRAGETSPAPAKSDTVTVLALRSTFWQGAGSPFGPRPVWCPEESPNSLKSPTPLSSYPTTPFLNTLSISSAGDPEDPDRKQQAWHPIRPAKPAPGAVVYSRWIPHLQETFSMVSLDWTDEEHLRLFHEWQNDPRVSQGWNETGTLEQHREYLRKIHEDPHQYAVLAKWDDTFFAYFEVYWAKVRFPRSPSYRGSLRLENQLLTSSRRIDWVLTSTRATLIAVDTPSSATSASVVLTVSRRGGAV